MPVLRDEPLDTLVLATFARRGGSPSAVSAALHPSLREVTSRRALTVAIAPRIDALTERALILGRGLTSGGRQHLGDRVGSLEAMQTRSWRLHLAVPALGSAPHVPALHADALAAEILRQRFTLPLPAFPDLDLVVRAMGYGTPRRRTRQQVRGLAATTVGSSSNRASALARAIVSTWVTGASRLGAIVGGRPNFSDEALRAARTSPTGRVGDTYVLISHAWRQLAQGGPPLSLDRFKHELVTAHRQRALSLKAADMPQLHDPSDLAESEVRYRGSRFHFIRI